MNKSKPSQEIDFFDFLYEIWRTKWMFLAIVLICTGAPIVWGMLRGNVTSAEPETYTATLEIPVVMNPGYDPLSRSDFALMLGLTSFVDQDQAIGLVFDGIFAKNEAKSAALIAQNARSYVVHLDEGDGVGTIKLSLSDASDALHKQIHDEFLRASKSLFEETKAMTEGAVTAFNSANIPEIFGTSSVLGKSLLFSKAPSVQDGSFRFIKIQPLQVTQDKVGTGSITPQSKTKSIVLGAVIGFVLACVMIMFRIAIRRKTSG